MSRKMPPQKPGKSRQDFQTPPEFLKAVKRKLGIDRFSIDLAATKENTVADHYYTEADNALIQPWSSFVGWEWCNPPFGHMEQWVRKACEETHVNGRAPLVAMLAPCSVGSNWWRNYVDRQAYVLFLNGRLTFVGEHAPYIKDLALLLYSPWSHGGYSVWNWRLPPNEEAL